MDLVKSCKDKLAYFRIKELKDVLNQLNLAKQGKKQDLVDRIMSLLTMDEGNMPGWRRNNAPGKEAVAKIIDDTYRKMQVHGATDLASRSHSGSDYNHVKAKEETDDSGHLDPKVRCICGSSLLTDSMIKCEDRRCQVWQHIGCVLVPEKPMECPPEPPSHFYCELCRLIRADPFWVTMGHPLLPVKFTSSGVASDGSTLLHTVERTFQLSRADRETLQRSEYDLQVWCMLLNDKVQFRMQWPQYAELQINGVPIRVAGRPGSQLLGFNGRDDGPVITTCIREGLNKICLTRCDARTFCFGVRIAKRRTAQQVLSLVPKEGDGEHFDDALVRVRRCTGGGNNMEDADSDSDLEVVAESVTVNLRCPMSGSRIRIAGRFKPCIHLACFDLEAFVELNQRSRKWQCPICLKNYSLENIIIDPFFNRITSSMLRCGEDVNEVEVKPDGSWRVKCEMDQKELSQWHLPDGSLCETKQDITAGSENLNNVKQEGTSEGYTGLRLGIRKNRNGMWEVSKAEVKKAPISGDNQNHMNFGGPNGIPIMASSHTESYREGEDPSVNQEAGMQFDLSLNNSDAFDSLCLNFDQAYNVDERGHQQMKDADVIVLSDSDEENPPGTNYDTCPASVGAFTFSGNQQGFPERYIEAPTMVPGGPSGIGLFNGNADDFEINGWPLQPCSQPGQQFQFFGADNDVSDALVDSHNSLGIGQANGYDLDSNAYAAENSGAPVLSNCHSGADLSGNLVDNPLTFGGEDPALQIFLPTRPAGVHLQTDLRQHSDMPNGIHSDWISLTLRAGGGHESTTGLLSPQQQVPFKEAATPPLTDAASALLSMNDEPDVRIQHSRMDNIFSHPRQPRSVRPRLCLSIDTDSE